MIYFQKAGRYILSDVDLYIPEGITVGVIGASGAGKTTLLRLACGLLECEFGMVRTMGRDPVRDRKKLAADLRAYFSEYYYFQQKDTVQTQFRLLEKIYQIDRGYSRKEYRRLAELFHIDDFVDRRVSQLSVGQRRRAELAAILMGKAKLLLFDEPANGLDEMGKQAFWDELQRRKESGTTILISSHNMEEIERVCDRILLLEAGNILYYGDKEGLMCRYAPVNQIEVRFEGDIPDMEDLPLLGYRIENNLLWLSYNANHISAAEIMKRILEQTSIIGINIVRQELTDAILARRDAGQQREAGKERE